MRDAGLPDSAMGRFVTPNPIVAVVYRDPWYTLIYANGYRRSVGCHHIADRWPALGGLTVRWDLPKPCGDGRTAYPLEPISVEVGA